MNSCESIIGISNLAEYETDIQSWINQLFEQRMVNGGQNEMSHRCDLPKLFGKLKSKCYFGYDINLEILSRVKEKETVIVAYSGPENEVANTNMLRSLSKKNGFLIATRGIAVIVRCRDETISINGIRLNKTS